MTQFPNLTYKCSTCRAYPEVTYKPQASLLLRAEQDNPLKPYRISPKSKPIKTEYGDAEKYDFAEKYLVELYKNSKRIIDIPRWATAAWAEFHLNSRKMNVNTYIPYWKEEKLAQELLDKLWAAWELSSYSEKPSPEYPPISYHTEVPKQRQAKAEAVTPEVTIGQYAKITFKGVGEKQQTRLVKFIHEKGTRRSYRVVNIEGEITDELVIADKADIIKEVPMRMNLKYGELEEITEVEPKLQLLPKTEAGSLEKPPTVLTMEEFHRTWEPQGWKLLVIGPTATWRTEWGEWEAIRDIVQNCLDETERYDSFYDDQGLCIRDIGGGIAVADFLLGPAKPKPPHARGKFGEGMKIAALALLRKGYSVKVDTVGKEVWIVFLKVKVDGEAEQLAALWRSNGRRRGTFFHIIGYSGSAFEDRFAVNIPKRDILHQGPSPLSQPIQRYNQLIAHPFGRVYARDIYMKDIDSPFSYNLWGFEMAPDRFGPKNESDMWRDIGRLWATCGKVNLLERFLKMIISPPLERTDESGSLIMSWMGEDPISGKAYADLVKDHALSWQMAWGVAIGENAVIRTDERWDGVVKHLGYVPVSMVWDARDTLGKVIKTDRTLMKESQERLTKVKIVPANQLTERALTHLKLATKIASRWHFPPVSGVHAAIIPPASDLLGQRTAGLYDKATEAIFIALDQLESAGHTVDVLIHEIAHHTSGAEDGQEAHNREMTVVAAHVVQAAAARAYDEELKEAVW